MVLAGHNRRCELVEGPEPGLMEALGFNREEELEAGRRPSPFSQLPIGRENHILNLRLGELEAMMSLGMAISARFE